jgi:hypothetical protein
MKTISALAALAIASAASAQNWVNYSNQTSTRLVGPTSVIGANNLEKDFGWGDLSACSSSRAASRAGSATSSS